MNVSQIQERITDKTRPVYTIRIASDLIGVSVHTLRMYESEGLILPRRTESQHRLYSQIDIERLQCIRIMIEEHGFNLAGIKAMMSMAPCWTIKGCSADDRNQCEAYNDALEPCWVVKTKADICSEADCTECPVYLEVTTCHNMKSFLKEHWKNA
ncbi:MAG: MerR family transcriptional regulator [Candidatus Marinimicrobia bacterium]|nr:MerR family transcriptional regulator [Candidatus Neomarinimicrobiota bacterium]